jgi:hypothetical protein
MAILVKGQTFADANSVTSTKLNNLVDAAAFVAGSSGTTDDTSLEVNGSGRLQIKDLGVSSAKISASAITTTKLPNSTLATDGVTYAKLQRVANMRVIGNTSGALAVASEVPILDEDTMVSDSATSLATQQSIKAYVDSLRLKYSGATVFTGSMPTTFADLDLSATLGAGRYFVDISVAPDASAAVRFRPNGETKDLYTDISDNDIGASGFIGGGTTDIAYVRVMTDTSGIVEWRSTAAGAGGTVVKLLSYQKMA